MNYQEIFRLRLQDIILKTCQQENISLGESFSVQLEIPKDRHFGDLTTNVAMILAKSAKRNPRELAQIFLPAIAQLPQLASCEIAGPGFINITLENSFWFEVLKDILQKKENFGRSDLGKKEKVNVEYVSANPTGPLHIGHLRGAIFGDVLASLLENCGYDVTREYYINDAGGQIKTLVDSFTLRYREACGEEIGPIAAGLYPGDYLKTAAEEFYTQQGDRFLNASEQDAFETFESFIVPWILRWIRKDLENLGIHMDVWSSEKRLITSGGLKKFLTKLEEMNLVYTGTLPPPKGKPVEDWEPHPQLLLKTSLYGDEIDRPLKKSDGSWTYMAADAAYHIDKFNRSDGWLIDIWGADHGGYVKRIQAALEAMTDRKARFDVYLCAMVRLVQNGVAEKMSKRAGNFVLISDLLAKVGLAPLRFTMLSRKNGEPLDFNLEAVIQQSRENPIFYVQYAYARTHSILKQAYQLKKENNLPLVLTSQEAEKNVDFSLLHTKEELALLKQIGDFPRFVEHAAIAGEPHRLYYYLMETASLFHALWTQGNQQATLRFINLQDPALTNARLSLVLATQTVLQNALNLLGIPPVEALFSS